MISTASNSSGSSSRSSLLVPVYGDAAASVTPQKQQRLLKAARLWLCRQNGSFETVDCRFDVVAFTGNEVEWIKDAFNDHS